MAGGGEKETLFLMVCLLCCQLELTGAVCVDGGGKPVACSPPPQDDLLLGLTPEDSGTCGLLRPQRFCYQTAGGDRECDLCDSRSEELAHPPSLVTDGDPHTFWLSLTDSAAITFPLSKTFQISRVSVAFYQHEPESFAIFKSTDGGETFVPFQYFSLSCEATYGVPEGSAGGEEAVALCSSPDTALSDGKIVFQPLADRTADAAISEQLQAWVLATHLQLRLDRRQEAEFYAVSAVEVSGSCYCSGHAASCVGSVGGGDVECVCEHGTTGSDCGQCRDFYQDIPWAPATPDNPASCLACNCNNHSETCHFDMERYQETGGVSGGVCDGCRDNTEGDQCQTCSLGYYPSSDLPLSSPHYCSLCVCDPRGTVGGEASCISPPAISPVAPASEACPCKANVDGRRCSECQTGFHHLNISNDEGCEPCPACYEEVALEFNKTQTLLSSLMTHLTSPSSPDLLPADLLQEIQDYQLIVQQMHSRTLHLLNQERNLSSQVNLVSMETDYLEDLIGQFEMNVSQSEEGVARIVAESGQAAELLVRLRESVAAIERAVRQELVVSLAQARERLTQIDNIFTELVNLSLSANVTSATHHALALDLLTSANDSSTTAQEALQLLSLTISLHTSTSALVQQLMEEQAGLDTSFTDASSDLEEARVVVSFVVQESRALLQRLQNTTISEYDTTQLQARLDALETLTAELVSDTALVSSEFEGVERAVEGVRERAGSLLAESAELNLLAVELLARAHAALSFANQTVEEGNQFVFGVEETLRELQARLENSTGFLTGLEEVVQNVLMAEELVGEVETEGGRRQEEVREAAQRVEEAVEAFEQATQLSTQALQVALRAREEARRALFNATLLAAQADDVGRNVSRAEERGTELESVAMDTAELVDMATEVAQTATSDARSLQDEAEQLLEMLEQLHVELNSTEVLPSDRLSEVVSMVTELEARADSNQLTLDTLENQVGQLEESSSELRERHRELQQHRDLLQSILDNIQRLDCRNQFQSI